MANSSRMRQYVPALAAGITGMVSGGALMWVAMEKRTTVLPADGIRTVTKLEAELSRFGWPSSTNIKVREGYIASYDRRMRNPAWVCEHITKESIKKQDNVQRENFNFKVDQSIPNQFRVKPNDYAKSGYDRGHLAPARNLVQSQKAMEDSFLMTNISPQVGNGFNRDYWSRFEGFIRHLANSYKNVYTITGPLYLPHLDKKTKKNFVKYEVIGPQSNIAVPTHFFKVIVAEKSNGQFVSGGFILPNKVISPKQPLSSFIAPISEIEKFSGLLFFDQVEKQQAKPLCDDTKCGLAKAYKKAANSK